MPVTSLRATLGGMSALAVMLVASVTLSIALTTSIDAIRALGERHAAVLLSIADDEASKLFGAGSDSVQMVLDLARSRDWPWPSDEPSVAARFAGAVEGRFTTLIPTGAMDSLTVYFADQTRVLTAGNGSVYRNQYIQVSPYSSTWPNTVVLNDTDTLHAYDDHRPVGYTPNPNTFFHRNDSLWAGMGTLTFGAYAPGATPPIAFFSYGRVQSYITMVGPMYKYGETRRHPDYVFGYVLASLTIDALSGFLRRVRSTPNTAVFVYDRTMNLLGTSSDTPMATFTPSSEYRGALRTGCSNTAEYGTDTNGGMGSDGHQVVCRMHVSEYPHAELNAVAAQRPELLRRPLGDPTVMQVPLDSGRVYAAAAQVRIAFRGLEVHLLLLMPEADVIGDVITGRNVAIGVTCGLVVLAATINALVVWALLAPLGGIAERMVRAANLEDDAEDTSVSMMSEVAELQEAYYAMNDELNRIRSYVPQSVLVAKKAALSSEGDDEDDEASIILHDDAGSQAPKRMSRSGSLRTSSVTETPRKSGPGSVVPPRSPVAAAGLSAAGAMRGLTTRSVSVVAANLRGLHSMAAEGGNAHDAVATELAAAVAAAERAVAPRHGVLTFHGDRFLATFNAARACAGHAVKAATVAAELLVGGPPTLPFTVGVATGPCLVGPVGSATLKTHSVIGSAVSDAAALERLAREHHADDSRGGAAALATYRTATEAQASVPLRFVDLIALPGRNGVVRALAVAALLAQDAAEGAGDGAKPKKSSQPEDGEWMYVAAHAERTAGPYDACFEALQRGDAAGCLQAFAAIEAGLNQQREKQQAATTGSSEQCDAIPEVPARLLALVQQLQSSLPTDGTAEPAEVALKCCRRLAWS